MDCLEAPIAICDQSGIREGIDRKVTDSSTKGTKQNYPWMFEQWCSFCNERGSPVLKVCMSKLVEYLDHFQVPHDYAYTTLCIHASAICHILQLTEYMRASTAPLVKQLLKGLFRRKPPTRVWADTWDVKKVLDLMHVCGKPSVVNYTSYPEDSHGLGPSQGEEAIRSESTENHSGVNADIRGLNYLQTGV